MQAEITIYFVVWWVLFEYNSLDITGAVWYNVLLSSKKAPLMTTNTFAIDLLDSF